MYSKMISKEGGQIKRTCDTEGLSLEEQLRQATANNTPIDARAPMIYTEKKDGVLPQYDPRTDRYDLALDAIEKVQKAEIAKGDNKPDVPPVNEPPKND